MWLKVCLERQKVLNPTSEGKTSEGKFTTLANTSPIKKYSNIGCQM